MLYHRYCDKDDDDDNKEEEEEEEEDGRMESLLSEKCIRGI